MGGLAYPGMLLYQLVVEINQEKGFARPVVSAEIGNFFSYCILPFGVYSQEIKCPSQSMAGGLVSSAIDQFQSPLTENRSGCEVNSHDKYP